MTLKPVPFTILCLVSLLNIAWADESCLDTVPAEVSSLARSVKTIYPNVSERSLHYLYKNFVKNHKSCRDDEIWVQGPLFAENGVTSEGDLTSTMGLAVEELGNSFCMSKILFEYERNLGKSIFQTRVSSGSKNEGTSFLVGDNIIMTNHHVGAPGPDGEDCKSLEITLNQEKEEWIGCKKVLFCDKIRDVCFVEMNQVSPGVEIGNLVPKVKLNCSKVVNQSGMLIGNSYKAGIQASAGPIKAEVNGRIKHHIPMVGGASGSPVMSNDGEVVGINYGHLGLQGKLKSFVSLDEDTDHNVATSMYWVKSEITHRLQESQNNVLDVNKLSKQNDLKKIDQALRRNPSCNSWAP